MYTYQLFGLKLKTDLEFKQLITDIGYGEPDVTITSGSIPEDIIQKETKRKYEFGEKISWLSNKTCRLMVESGNQIIYSLKEGGNSEYLRNYILGWGMSMLALQRGILAIHCSAVTGERGAILICGESGAGKSTMTTAFLENGYRLMADDMAFVEVKPGEKALASPAFPYQKLCRDAALAKGYNLDELIYIDEDKDKFLVPYREEFQLDTVPVRGMLVLGVINGDEVLTREVIGLNRFHMVANNLFLRHLLGEQKYEPRTGQLCLNMAAAVPIEFIGRPAGYDTAREVMEKAFSTVEKW